MNRNLRKKDQSLLDALARVDIFAGFEPVELESLAAITHKKSFTAGTRLFEQGHPGEEFFIIIKGSLKISVLSEEGHELVLAYLRPHDFFGEMALLDDYPRSAGAEAVEDLELLSIHKNHFRKLLSGKPQMALPILQCLARRIRTMINDLASSAFMDAYHRVASKLLVLARDLGEIEGDSATIRQKLTHQKLAALVGTTRETVTKILNEMKRQKLIRVDHQQITILALERMRRMVM